MLQIVFNSEVLADGATENRAIISGPKFAGACADEVVELVNADFIAGFERGNKGDGISFTVSHAYGTIGEALLALPLRNRDMVQQATLDLVVTFAGVTTTLRMKDALRRPVNGTQRGLVVEWEYEFFGAKFALVETPAGAPDYMGGVADSGDAATAWYWGGTCNDGSGVGVPWSRTIDGGEMAAA